MTAKSYFSITNRLINSLQPVTVRHLHDELSPIPCQVPCLCQDRLSLDLRASNARPARMARILVSIWLSPISSSWCHLMSLLDPRTRFSPALDFELLGNS